MPSHSRFRLTGCKRSLYVTCSDSRLKLVLADRAPKTVNNVLTVLSTLLKKAAEWGELGRLPCAIKLLPNPKKTMGFHDFDQYERLLGIARKRDRQAYVMVLLGGD